MKNLLRILYSGIVIAPASLALVSVKYDNTTVANPKETSQEVNFNTIRSEFIDNFNNDTKFANLDEAMKSIENFPNTTNMKNNIYVKQVTVNSNVASSTNINNYVAFDVKISLVDEINTSWNIPGVDQIFTLTTYVDNRNLIEKSAYQKSLEEYIVADDNDFFKNPLEVKKRILKYNQIRSADTVITSVIEGDIVSKESEKVYEQKYQVNVIALDTYKWSTDTTTEVIEVIVQIDGRGYVNSQEVLENLQSNVANTYFNSVANAQQAIETAEKADGVKEIKAVFDKEVKTAINGKVLFNVTVSIEENFKWKDGTIADKTYSVEAFVDERNEINKNDIEVAMKKYINAKGHFENPQAIIAAINEFKFTGISNVKGELSNKQQRDLATASFKVTFDVDVDYKLKDSLEPVFYFDYEYAASLNIEDVKKQLSESLKEVETYQSPEEVIAKLESTEILGIKEIKVQNSTKTRAAINGTFEVSLVADEGYLFEGLKNTAEIKVSQNYAKIIKNNRVQDELQNFLDQAHYESPKDIITAIETKFVFEGLKNFKVVNTREAIMESFNVSFETEAGYEMAKNNSTQVVVKKEYAILLRTAEIKSDLEKHLKDMHFDTSEAIVKEIQTNFKYTGIKNVSVAESRAPITKQYVISFETELGYALEKDNDFKFVIEKDHSIILKTAPIQTELNKYLGDKTFETAEQIVDAIQTNFSYKGIKNIKASYPKGNARGIANKTFTITFDTADGYDLASGEINSFTVQKSYVKYIKTQEVIDSVKGHIGTQEFGSQKEFIDFLVELGDPMYNISSVKQKSEGGDVYTITFTAGDGFQLFANEKYSFELNTSIRYTYDDIIDNEYSNDFSTNFNDLLYIFSNQGSKTIVHTLNANRDYVKVTELDEATTALEIYNNKIYVGTALGNIITIDSNNNVKKIELKNNGKPIAAIAKYNNRLFVLGLNQKLYRSDGNDEFRNPVYSTSGSGTVYNILPTHRFFYYRIDNNAIRYMALDRTMGAYETTNISGLSATTNIRDQFAAFARYGNYTIYSTGFNDEKMRYINTNGYYDDPNLQTAYAMTNSPDGTVSKFAEMGSSLFFTMINSGKVYRIDKGAEKIVQSDFFETNKNLKSVDKLNGELYFTGNKFIGIRNSNIKLK
ncbi:hypothetical protein [Mesoplasma seiffertii]|uniref:hypothetical protein n=1 Tax=Mesoplasma seiffertii TaxID=28224 RepID=UPI00047BBEA8|nr:hypothetical protein [Mesoplasma seiffertii]